MKKTLFLLSGFSLLLIYSLSAQWPGVSIRDQNNADRGGAAGYPRMPSRQQEQSVQGKPATATVAAYFSPEGQCASKIISTIARAKREILVAAYSFTNHEIADALVEASQRGVSVDVLLDGVDEFKVNFPIAEYLAQKGGGKIKVGFDSVHSRMHDKFFVFDQTCVITGSYNLTKEAETKNAENLVLIVSAEIASQFRQNWTSIAAGARIWNP